MHILDLPEEILIIIIKQLDMKSKHNLYETCHRMKNIISMQGVIRTCNLSLNTLATVKSLQLEMVKQISSHLRELNMSGVGDLTKSALLSATKRMKSLETLDVSYTRITILDLLDVYRDCPTIKNIAINFQFMIPEAEGHISNEILIECQEVFKKIVNVHFILNPLLTLLPLYILKFSSINTLKYTICEQEMVTFENYKLDKMFPFNHICVFILYKFRRTFHEILHSILAPINIDDYEYIVIEYTPTYIFRASPMFIKFLSETYNNLTFRSVYSQRNMGFNSAIFIWNKTTTVFDEVFFCNLKKKLREMIVCEFTVANGQPLIEDIDTHTYDWFKLIPLIPQYSEECKNIKVDKSEPVFKKSRNGPQCILHYDTIFKEHVNVKLFMSFDLVGTVSLSANSGYLKKLTYLCLKGLMVVYSNGFFNILFRCCENLITLSVEGSITSSCCSPIMRSIPLSKSLKNLRLVDYRIDFNMLFSSFSQCTTLENIHIVDTSMDFNNLADPTALFQKCTNLYSLYIKVSMSECSIEKKLQMLNTAKENCSKHHLHLSLHSVRHLLHTVYDPYVHIFNLDPIKPV